jgi:hypothetical protein
MHFDLELDQEEEDRRKQEVEAARAMEDGGLDDPIEPEDPTDVNKMILSFSLHSFSMDLDFRQTKISKYI